MDNTLRLEVYIFITSIYGGLIVGLIYDLYNAFRFFTKPKKISTFIEDLIFWLIISLIFFYILIKTNQGIVRGFIVLGYIFGIFVYMKILNKIIYPIIIKIFKLILNLINEIISLILYPFLVFKKKISPEINRWKKLPKEMGKEIKKYKKIISKKK